MIADLLSALEHAPTVAPKGPAGLTGWRSGDVVICERCAARIVARGCGHLLSAMRPVWDEPVTCALEHTPAVGRMEVDHAP